MEKTIGFNIRKVRELKNVSQKYMANKLLVSQSAYSNIENGKTPISDEKLTDIAKALEVSEEVIKGFSDQMIFQNSPQSGCYNTNTMNVDEEKDKLYKDLIEQYKSQIASLQDTIKAKDEVIASLKNK